MEPSNNNNNNNNHTQSSAVWHHANWFADNKGIMTNKSMTEGHTEQGIYTGCMERYTSIYPKVTVINEVMNKSCDQHGDQSHVPQCLVNIFNPASSGLWDKSGNFDQARFNQLKERSIKNLEGKDSVTASIFQQFAIDGREGKDGGTAGHFWSLAVSWRTVTNGSITELVKFYSDGAYKTEDGTLEDAITLEKVEQFYKDPASVMREKKSKFESV